MTLRMGDAGGGGKPKPKGNQNWSNPWHEKPHSPYERGMSRAQWVQYVTVLHENDAVQPPEGAAWVNKYTQNHVTPGNGRQANPNQGEHGGGRGGSLDEGNGVHTQGHTPGGIIGMIINFFRGKGLSDVAIAGILGNWRVESGFSPTAFNPREGAIGFGQWEGGRRTALQEFAARRGTSETDPQTQLEFAWHELTTGYTGVLSALRTASSASQAATEWNLHYEMSADHSGDREQYASTYLSNGFHGISVSNTGSGGGAAGLGALAGTQAVAHLTSTDYKAALGSLAGLIQGVPELRSILNQAISQGRTTDWFLQRIQQTDWWRHHDSSARTLIALQYQDPAEYKNQLGSAQRSVAEMAHGLGVQLSPNQIHNLAWQSLVEGWDSQTLQDKVGALWNDHGKEPAGQAAQLYQQLQQIYGDQGLPVGDQALDHRVRQILAGNTTIDTYSQAALAAAKSMYPSLAHQLDLGMSVKDIADPYVQTEANLLELDPNTISFTSPLIKKALQGSIVQNGDKATAMSTPIWKFEEQVRNDPRWQYTNNAHDQVSNVLNFLGQSWGFEA